MLNIHDSFLLFFILLCVLLYRIVAIYSFPIKIISRLRNCKVPSQQFIYYSTLASEISTQHKSKVVVGLYQLVVEYVRCDNHHARLLCVCTLCTRTPRVCRSVCREHATDMRGIYMMYLQQLHHLQCTENAVRGLLVA